jgi:bla regulator protein blaR1
MPLDSADPIAFLVFLLNAAVQIGIVAAGTALALRVTRAASPSVRHRIAIAGLALCIVVPMLAAWPATHLEGATTIMTASVDLQTLARDRIAVALVYGYLALLLWKAVALTRATLATMSLRRTCTPIIDGPIVASFERCNPAGSIQLCRSEDVPTPVVFGVAWPVIVCPDGFEDSDRDVIDAVIAHESAHVARHDVAITLAIEILTIPFAFHPAVAALKRAAARYRELACDERALARLRMPRRTYASALVRVAEFGTGGAAVAAAGAASHLEARIRELLERRRGSRVSLATRGLVCGCLVAATAIAPLFAIALDAGWRELSGVWTLDVYRSEPRGRLPFLSVRLDIDATANHLVIAQRRTRRDGRIETFEIRGTPDDVPFKVALPGGAFIRMRARWEGSRLIRTFSGPGGHWRGSGEATATGNRLVIRTEDLFGNTRRRSEFVFRREGGTNVTK